MKIGISMNHNEARRVYQTFKKLAAMIGKPCTEEMDDRVTKYLDEDHSKDSIRIDTHPGYNIEIQDTDIVFDISTKLGAIIADILDDVLDQVGGVIGYIRGVSTAFKGITAAALLRYHKAFDRPKTYAMTKLYILELNLCRTYLIENDGYDNCHVKHEWNLSGSDVISSSIAESMMWAQANNVPLHFDYTEENYEKKFEQFTSAVRADWNGDHSENKTEE